jgi:hypothetical protein
MSIRRIIQTGVISSAIVLSTASAAFANNGGGGGHHHHHHGHSLLELALLIRLGLLHGCHGLLGLF